MNYSPLTRRHFDAAGAAGTLQGADVVRGAAGSPAAGSWVRFDLRLAAGPAGVPVVAEARFLAFGCPHTIAVADWLATTAPGTPLAAALPEPVHAVQQRFGIPVEKLGRLLVIQDAWCAAARAGLARR
jgi:NifU-like protein involved in Fe-S cluster formation